MCVAWAFAISSSIVVQLSTIGRQLAVRVWLIHWAEFQTHVTHIRSLVQLFSAARRRRRERRRTSITESKPSSWVLFINSLKNGIFHWPFLQCCSPSQCASRPRFPLAPFQAIRSPFELLWFCFSAANMLLYNVTYCIFPFLFALRWFLLRNERDEPLLQMLLSFPLRRRLTRLSRINQLKKSGAPDCWLIHFYWNVRQIIKHNTLGIQFIGVYSKKANFGRVRVRTAYAERIMRQQK